MACCVLRCSRPAEGIFLVSEGEGLDRWEVPVCQEHQQRLKDGEKWSMPDEGASGPVVIYMGDDVNVPDLWIYVGTRINDSTYFRTSELGEYAQLTFVAERYGGDERREFTITLTADMRDRFADAMEWALHALTPRENAVQEDESPSSGGAATDPNK